MKTMLSFFLLLMFYLPFSSITLATEDDYVNSENCLEGRIESRGNRLANRSWYQDVSRDVLDFENFANKCLQVNNRLSPYLIEQIIQNTKLKLVEIPTRLEYQLKEIVEVSKYKDPSNEIELFKKTLNEVNLDKYNYRLIDYINRLQPYRSFEEEIKRGKNKTKEKDPSQGGYCTSVDVSKDSVVKNKVRNVGDVSWCYAGAASDLLSHYENKYISLLGAGIAYNTYSLAARKEKNRLNPDIMYMPYGGYPDETINLMLDKGFCTESLLPSRAESTEGESFNFLDSSIYKELVRVWQTKKIETCSQISSIAPNIDTRLLMEIANKVNKDSYFDQLYKNFCVERSTLNNKYVAKTLASNNPDILFKKINEKLTSKEPIGIQFNILTLYNKYSTNSNPDHAVTIWAREFKNGSCHYKLKNDYGENCKKFSYEKDFVCEKGEFWVPEEYLARTIKNVFYMEKK